jgi:hypothetical protein
MELGSTSVASSSPPVAIAASSACFSPSRFSRRRRSIALLRAVVVIQAPGLRGSPRLGQTSRAVTKAS